MSTCVILGASGYAREVMWHALGACNGSYDDFVFVDDINPLERLNCKGVDWPVEKEWNFDKYRKPGKTIGFIVGIGDPRGKMVLVEKALRAGLEPLPTVIHANAGIQADDNTFGVGGLIAPSCTIVTNVTIGDYVTLNTNSLLGHDGVVGDYVTTSPGTLIAGGAKIGNACFFGLGCTVREKTRIASFTTVGMLACVTKDIEEEGLTVVGIPARPIERR